MHAIFKNNQIFISLSEGDVIHLAHGRVRKSVFCLIHLFHPALDMSEATGLRIASSCHPVKRHKSLQFPSCDCCLSVLY